MQNKLQQAHLAHQKNKLDEAETFYRECLETEPNNPEAHHALCIVLAKQDKLDEALEALTSLLKIESDNPSIYNTQGNILLRMKKLPEAIKAFEAAIEIDAEYAPALNNLGNCYYQQKDWKTALSFYQKAYKALEIYADAYFNAANCLINLERLDDAKVALTDCIKHQDTHPHAHGTLGGLLLESEDFQQAEFHLDKQDIIDPKDPLTEHNLGLALLKQDQLEEAEKYFIMAIDDGAETNLPDIHYHLATTYLLQTELSKALQHYLLQIQINANFDSYYNAAVILMYQERHAESLQYFKHALTLKPDNFSIYVNMATVYLKTNKTDEAIEYYKHAQKIQPNDKEIEHILAALQSDETPTHAPQEYLANLFDQYAPHYEKHLTEFLKYSVPEQLFKTFEELETLGRRDCHILDLGCGTGLTGERFYEIAETLEGIDASDQMIQQAAMKRIYTELHTADIHQKLTELENGEYDIILAGDVFSYIGDLNAIFKECHRLLCSNGIFGFTVEKTFEKDYILQKSVRYAHSRRYIESLATQYGFKIETFINSVMREQQHKPVEGYLVWLRKSEKILH